METKFKPIPPTYQGQHWTARLLKSTDAAALKKVISLYGVNAINSAVAINAQRGIK